MFFIKSIKMKLIKIKQSKARFKNITKYKD
jgi:hypothetical protein